MPCTDPLLWCLNIDSFWVFLLIGLAANAGFWFKDYFYGQDIRELEQGFKDWENTLQKYMEKQEIQLNVEVEDDE